MLAEISNVYHSYDVPVWLWATLPAVLVAYAVQEWWHVRKDHVIGLKEATRWSVFYIACAQVYSLIVLATLGSQAFGEYQAAYWIEKALSLDNLVVIGLIFTSFEVPKNIERRMLDYGIIGALVMRMVFIFAGLELIHRFEWITIIFGLILARASYKVLSEAFASGEDGEEEDMRDTRSWRFIEKHLRISDNYDGHKLFTVENGKKMATMMLAVIVMIEMTDLIFAVDSVPAVMSVSPDRFVAYSSNIFAILGLRALFFLYENIKDRFWALNYGVGAVLGWIAFKMLAAPLGLHISVGISLAVLAVFLAGSVVVSLAFKRN
jgi:tellurite resistance protein TerC